MPLTYSDGDQDTNPDGPSTPAAGSVLDMDGNGVLTDDEKDADNDGLGNWDESHGRLVPEWWSAAYQNEHPFYGAPQTRSLSGSPGPFGVGAVTVSDGLAPEALSSARL